MNLSKADDIFKVTEKVQDAVQNWMLCKKHEKQSMQCSWLTINTMQFKLLNQLAIHRPEYDNKLFNRTS